MYFRLLRNWTLKQRVCGFMAIMSVIPLACLASTSYSMRQAGSAEEAMEVASTGAVSLAQLNAGVHAVVMESRGIYMSSTWKEAEPHAKGMERHLSQLAGVVERWKGKLVASERAQVEALAASVARFVQPRRELLRLAREDSIAAAKAFGDNDANRASRVQLDAQLDELTQAYVGDGRRAQELLAHVKAMNVNMLIALALGAVAFGAIGLLLLHRTVFKLFHRMGHVMQQLAAGSLEAGFEGSTRKDEIGDFARAIKSFKQSALQRLDMEAKLEQERQTAEAERRTAAAVQAEASKRQTEALTALAAALHRVSEGDLTARIAEPLATEFEELRSDFNRAVENLRHTVQSVVACSGTINSGTREIATVADDLSRRTEQQAASLEKTAAALDQITATVRKAAEGAKHARAVVASTNEDAGRNGTVVRKAGEAMGSIEKSSKQIGQIIGLIDEIAFQTNLLALNAGVEAARAGEAGRGFAVVASEVRALAQRSAQAASEIKNLISTSTAQVGEGVRLVAATGEALERIMAQVAEINSVVSDIAAGAQEQAAGLADVNTAVNEMDNVTQQNASMAEQATEASRSLAEEAEQLADIVGKFRLGSVARSRPGRHAVPKAA
jgi:methyl-accepting chemotaxis protein